MLNLSSSWKLSLTSLPILWGAIAGNIHNIMVKIIRFWRHFEYWCWARSNAPRSGCQYLWEVWCTSQVGPGARRSPIVAFVAHERCRSTDANAEDAGSCGCLQGIPDCKVGCGACVVQGMETWRQAISRSQENKGITANADTVKGLQVWHSLK